MDLVNICVYADGYYSGMSYEENIVIRKDTYKKISEDLSALEVYISELDGKHSEVKADIEFQIFDETDVEEAFSTKNNNDGDTAYWRLDDIFKKNNMDLGKEVDIVNEYLNSLDIKIEKTVWIKKSQLEEFEKCMKRFK